MKKITIFLLLIVGSFRAQSDSILLDRNFEFKNGIYTSVNAILHNSPQYPEATLTKEWCKKADSIVGFAKNAKMYMYVDRNFHKLLVVGSLCIFSIESEKLDWENELAHQGWLHIAKTKKTAEFFCLDFKTGYINLLTCNLMKEILKRDKDLLEEFSIYSEITQRQTLYSYVLKYNKRNFCFIKT